MLETTQAANYPTGGMITTTKNANYSTGGILETVLLRMLIAPATGGLVTTILDAN